MKRKVITEANVLKAIRDYLDAKGVVYIRNNSGAVVGEHKGKKRFFRFGSPGSADLIGCSSSGRFWACEVKAPGKKATKEQMEWLVNVRINDGYSIWVDNVDGFINWFENWVK